jgi:hypothetical protein
MASNPILAAGVSLPGLELHARHRGVHGDTKNQQSTDPASDTAPVGTTQHLFSHLMDSAQEMMAINPAAAAKKP